MSARTCASATKPAPRRAAPLTARRRAARCAAAPRNGLLSAGLAAAVSAGLALAPAPAAEAAAGPSSALEAIIAARNEREAAPRTLVAAAETPSPATAPAAAASAPSGGSRGAKAAAGVEARAKARASAREMALAARSRRAPAPQADGGSSKGTAVLGFAGVLALAAGGASQSQVAVTKKSKEVRESNEALAKELASNTKQLGAATKYADISEAQVKNLMKENSSLTSDLVAARKDLGQLKIVSGRLQQKLGKSEEAVAAQMARTEAAELEGKKERIKAEAWMSGVMSDLVEARKELGSFKGEAGQQRQRADKAEAALSATEDARAALETERDTALKQVADAGARLEEAQASLESEVALKEKFAAELATEQEARAGVEAQLMEAVEAASAKQEELENELRQLGNEIRKQGDSLEQAQDNLRASKAGAETDQKRTKELEAEVARGVEEAARMAEERGELLAKISELESSTSAEAARAEEKFAELRAAAKKSEAELKASRAELKAVKKSGSEKSAASEEMQVTADELREQVAGLMEKQRVSEAKRKQAVSDKQKVAEELKGVKARSVDNADAASRAEKMVAAKDMRIAALEEEVYNLQEDVAASREAANMAEARFSDFSE